MNGCRGLKKNTTCLSSCTLKQPAAQLLHMDGNLDILLLETMGLPAQKKCIVELTVLGSEESLASFEFRFCEAQQPHATCPANSGHC